MAVYEVDPIQDPRWARLLERDPRSSMFHTAGWLRALRQCYGYEPVVYTTSPGGAELQNGIVFCRVRSALTGSRLVSLPFSDHCQPLADIGETAEILGTVEEEARRTCLRYVELRPLAASADPPPGCVPVRKFVFHHIDLAPGLAELFGGLHKNCLQRKLRRAGREELTYECGNSQAMLDEFYPLFVMARRRHRLPPPPMRWLRTVRECLGDAVELRLARKHDIPVAGMLTITQGNSMVYKYGGSDSRFHQTGGVQMLFWKMLAEAKERGLCQVDLGRCEPENQSLLTYKERLGSRPGALTYWRYPLTSSRFDLQDWALSLAKPVFASVPDTLRIGMGSLLYRHVG
jgi:Acetyltransferase (GNAT) domain